MSIQAIQTVYKGYRFRSRLEARWAVFFDALGIAWEYEKEGFQLSDGEWYLPDFWLPSFCGGMWAEVKPGGGTFDHVEQFCIDSKQSIWLCEGVPCARTYDVLEADMCCSLMRGYGLMPWDPGYVSPSLPCPEGCTYENRKGCATCPHMEWEAFPVDGIPIFDQAVDENRMFWSPGYENSDRSLPNYMLTPDQPLVRAIHAARSARFEHGETPEV